VYYRTRQSIRYWYFFFRCCCFFLIIEQKLWKLKSLHMKIHVTVACGISFHQVMCFKDLILKTIKWWFNTAMFLNSLFIYYIKYLFSAIEFNPLILYNYWLVSHWIWCDIHRQVTYWHIDRGDSAWWISHHFQWLTSQ
jgi:hypothetical protein